MATGVLETGAKIVEGGIGAVQHAGRSYAPGVAKRPRSDLAREQEAIQKAGERWKINPAYLWGIYGVETSFGANISVSSTGARGPFQFEPATAKQYGYPLGVNEHKITNWGAFQQQANAAAHYLAAHGGVKDPTGAVRAYNPGEASYLSKVVAAAQSWGKAMTTEATNQQETEKVERNPMSPEGGTWGKFGELGLNLILILAGAALLVYGVMVMVRPRERALSPPKPGYNQIPVI
jgi:membrane-bound lytic murein transglycosylase B